MVVEVKKMMDMLESAGLEGDVVGLGTEAEDMSIVPLGRMR